jgi:hypothetical protein
VVSPKGSLLQGAVIDVIDTDMDPAVTKTL